MSHDAGSRESQVPNEGDEVGLLDLLVVLVRYRKPLVGVPLAVAAVALVVCLLLPNTYTGTTKLLPPQQTQSTTTALLAQFGALMAAGIGNAGNAPSQLAFRNPNDLYVGMLKSRSVADSLI